MSHVNFKCNTKIDEHPCKKNQYIIYELNAKFFFQSNKFAEKETKQTND